MDNQDLQPQIKKIALVTGASRGIGKAIALELAKQDIIVIGSATTTVGAQKISEYLQNKNGYGVMLDVTNLDSIKEVLAEIKIKSGSVNILVNNAGITKDNLFMRMKENEWDDVLTTNLKSIFLLSKEVIRNMLSIRYGRIINITSVIGFMGNMGQANYAAAKAGIVGMSKSLAREVGSRGITVNCIAPGFIETAMTDSLPEEVKDSYIKNIALARLGSTQDVANSVKFLASDDASYITGTTIHVNGGLYM